MHEMLIIENRTDLPMAVILRRAIKAVGMGRVSGNNDAYCYVTSFEYGIKCMARRNKASDTLVFWREAVQE